jgi:hypothetical protein
LARSDIDPALDTELPLTACRCEATNARAEFKDTIKYVKENRTQCESEVATSRVEHKYPHLVEGNTALALEREATIQKELKQRENKRVI